MNLDAIQIVEPRPVKDRRDACRRIEAALFAKTGKRWSCVGGRGTAWGWLRITPRPADMRTEYRASGPATLTPAECAERKAQLRTRAPAYMSPRQCEILGEALGFGRPSHFQGESVTPDNREYMVARLEEWPADYMPEYRAAEWD